MLDGNVTVAAGATLTIEPGVIVKFNGSLRKMTINGTLSAVGTQTSLITFTSYQDDTAGGDTNGDGSATTGAPGQWFDIEFASSGSQLKWVNIRYGGNGTAQNYAPVYLFGSGRSVTIDHATITNNQKSAVVVVNRASATISNSTLSNNNYGLFVDTATATVDHTTIANNSSRGVWFNLPTVTPAPAASSITTSDITGNSGVGVYVVANGDYPLASMPTGRGNNIYASNANGVQLQVTGFPSFKNTDVNWRGNYWGNNVYHWYGGGGCAGTAPNSPGHLAYRSSSGKRARRPDQLGQLPGRRGLVRLRLLQGHALRLLRDQARRQPPSALVPDARLERRQGSDRRAGRRGQLGDRQLRSCRDRPRAARNRRSLLLHPLLPLDRSGEGAAWPRLGRQRQRLACD